MVGKKELSLMKKTSWLINVARGNLIVERELIEGLEQKVIAGACLDVFEHVRNLFKKKKKKETKQKQKTSTVKF